jgi:hypothetical protein
MRLVSTASVGAFIIVAYFSTPHFDHATAATSVAVVTKPSTGVSLMTEAKCVKVEGKLKCGKHVSKNDDDGDHKHKNKDADNDDGTKTVKLIKEQDTCQVFTQGKGAMGCGGSSGFRTSRCDKLKDGDTVCCCYHADDSQ